MARKQPKVKPDNSISMGVNAIPLDNPEGIYGLYDSEFVNPTASNFRYYLECMRKGLNFWIALLFEHIRRRSLYIKAVCQTRKLPIIAKEWIVEYPDGNSEILDLIKNIFKGKWFYKFISDCVEANISGLSIFEINWTIENGKVVPEDVKLLPNHLTLYNDVEDRYEFIDIKKNTGFSLRAVGLNFNSARVDLSQIARVELPEEKMLVVESLDGTAGNGLLNGFIDGIIWDYMQLNYGRKDYSIFVNKHADPPVSAEYDPTLGSDAKKQAQSAASSFGRAKWNAHPNTVKFTVHDTSQKAATSQLFREYLNENKEEIAIAILGQALTTMSPEKGTHALGEVQELVRQDLQSADMIIVALAVNELIKRIVDMNFPSVTSYPEFRFPQSMNAEFKRLLSEVIKNLRVSGYKAKAEELSRLFDIEIEDATPIGGSPNDPGNENGGGNTNGAVSGMSEDKLLKRLVTFIEKKKKAELKKLTDAWLNEAWETAEESKN